MKKLKLIATLLIPLLNSQLLNAVSIVYNFRIAQITRQPITNETHIKPNAATVLLFNLFQKSNGLDLRENYTGGLGMFHRYLKNNFYIKSDIAIAHANQKVKNVPTVDTTEVDDILFTVGKNIIKTDHDRVSLSGLFGIPTHSVNFLQRVGHGTGQVGTGVQIDGLHKVASKMDVLWGSRYIYFIPRTAFDAAGNSYKFTVGSIADLLIALQGKINLKHGLEGGYAARWGFGINATPRIALLENFNYMRNSFYFLYKYTFLTERTAQRLMFNIAYGFDSKPKKIGYKAVMVWAAWGIAF